MSFSNSADNFQSGLFLFYLKFDSDLTLLTSNHIILITLVSMHDKSKTPIDIPVNIN
jgi:hypothetical protein